MSPCNMTNKAAKVLMLDHLVDFTALKSSVQKVYNATDVTKTRSIQ